LIEREILRKLLDVDELPTLPDIMNKILYTVESEKSTASDLTAILECDHAISARVLRMANSAFYGLPSEVDSIRRAVVVIGFDSVQLLALATSVFDIFSRKKQLALDPKDFWMHSLGTAKASQILAKKCPRIKSTDGCFTAGLLHDIGKFVLALTLKEQYYDIVKTAQESHRPLKDVEIEKLHTNHTEIGGWIAEKWHFPNTIIDVIKNIYLIDQYIGPNKLEVAIVALSDNISRAADFGDAGEYVDYTFDPKLIDLLNLNINSIDVIIEELNTHRENMDQYVKILHT